MPVMGWTWTDRDRVPSLFTRGGMGGRTGSRRLDFWSDGDLRDGIGVKFPSHLSAKDAAHRPGKGHPPIWSATHCDRDTVHLREQFDGCLDLKCDQVVELVQSHGNSPGQGWGWRTQEACTRLCNPDALLVDPDGRLLLDGVRYLTFAVELARAVSHGRREECGGGGTMIAQFFGITPAPYLKMRTADTQRQAEAGRKVELTPLERRRRGMR
jgi:hypothetical protein